MGFQSFEPPRRYLLAAGPSEVPPLVLQALARPTVGHLDPSFIRLMDELRQMLRPIFGTDNAQTLPMSGTGTAGMETALVNMIEEGDRVIVAVHGVFGARIADIARRARAEVREVHAEWGSAIDMDDLRREAHSFRPKLIAVVHGETSTGVQLDLAPIRAICDEVDALLIVDFVATLGGVVADVDRHRVDVAYAGSQKCLSCPPGLAPITLSHRAEEALTQRKTPVQSWYLDLSLIRHYWGERHSYHHTAPINLLYGLHEACRLVLEEGVAERAARHREAGGMLARGLEALGFELLAKPEDRMAPLTAVKIPAGVDDVRLRRLLLDRFHVEIGGGLGPLKGQIWRIGMMGYAATPTSVLVVLSALTDGLRLLGTPVRGDLTDAVAAMGLSLA